MGDQQADTNTSVNYPQPFNAAVYEGFQEADALRRLRQGGEPYGYQGSRVAGFDPFQQQAMSRVGEIAEGGSVLPSAMRSYERTVSGDYLREPNPYLDAAIDRGVQRIQGQVGRTFAGANAYGSGAFNRALADQAAGYATQAYAGNYERERDRMERAISLAPQMAAGQYADTEALYRTGQQRQAQEQAEIAADMARYYEDTPEAQLQRYTQSIMPFLQVTPGTTTTNTTQGRDWVQTGIGLGALAAAPFTGGATAMGGLGALGGAGGAPPPGGGGVIQPSAPAPPLPYYGGFGYGF